MTNTPSIWKASWLAVAAALLLLPGCGPSVVNEGPDGGSVVGEPCTAGAIACDGDTRLACVDGAFEAAEECSGACTPNLGCTVCAPGTGTCAGESAQVCRADGSGYDDFDCDPAQGLACNVDTGICDGACSPARLGRSYIGCEYYPTVTATKVAGGFDFAVAVSNAGSQTATVTVEGGSLTAPMQFDVQPGSVGVQTLPWQQELKYCYNTDLGECTNDFPKISMKVADGAFHLRSTQPVTVYQFSPLDYVHPTNPSAFAYTNDASLLLPVTALTGSYVSVGWPAWRAQSGFSTFDLPSAVAVTATEDGTQVTVDPGVAFAAGNGVPAMSPGAGQTVSLNAGDVVQLLAFVGDPTGTRVSADKPVQVISAHFCTNIPADTPACDHLEEAIFPVETLADEYIAAAPATPDSPAGRFRYVRITATEPGTSLTFDPPQPGVSTTLANVGDVVEIPQSTADFLVRADKKILVAEFMVGLNAGGNTGDPAMSLAVATEQYRTDYLFHAPLSYETNYVNVIAPAAALIQLDGAPVSGFTAIGSTGYGVARVPIADSVDGNHRITGSEPFGITVYGYGSYTSYWYPGGLDLDEVIID